MVRGGDGQLGKKKLGEKEERQKEKITLKRAKRP